MKLFKWIAADPEKLDKEKQYSAKLYNKETALYFDPVKDWIDAVDVEPVRDYWWPHIQVAVDAEVSEGAFAEWIDGKYFMPGKYWTEICYTPGLEAKFLTTAELYQEFLKQL